MPFCCGVIIWSIHNQYEHVERKPRDPTYESDPFSVPLKTTSSEQAMLQKTIQRICKSNIYIATR